MKKWHLFIISGVLIAGTSVLGSNNTEFRSTWVVTWEYINPDDSPEETQGRIRQIMQNHAVANMNAVLFQVRQSGTAYYSSSYEPWGYYAGGSDPGFDPLAYAVEEAHAKGLELHAWINVFQCSSTVPGAPVAEHPEWVCRDRDGNPMTAHRFLSPGLSAVREYLRDVILEVANNYDIDGIHLDFIRWPEYTNSAFSREQARLNESQEVLDGYITPEQLADLESNRSGRYLYDIEHPYSAGIPAGYSSWEEWWRDSVTRLVRIVHDSLQQVKPWVRLSVAALGRYNWGGWNGYNTVYQDAALWFNEGSIDQLTPMHYHWTSAAGFYNMLEGDCPQCWSQYIQPGVNEGRLYSVGPGSYILEDYHIWNRHPFIIDTCRQVSWVDGFQFFSYGSWEDYLYWPIAGNTFFKYKTKIRPWRNDVSNPDTPYLDLEKIDSLTYTLTITPPDTLSQKQWFAIYRDTNQVIATEQSPVIALFFSDSTFTFTDHYTGWQDYSGRYTYAVSMLSRFWVESPLSATVTTDSIPSFAPQVWSSSIADGDTVAVNAPLWFHFSKTMDTASVATALSITPALPEVQLQWTEHRHTLTISYSGNLDYDTNYMLIISPAAVDINGTPLDGNGDGQPGDAFQISFHTQAVDLAGPIITYSYPALDGTTADFDPEGVITLVFDELVDPTTISTGTIAIHDGATEYSLALQLTALGLHNILNVQPYETLPSANVFTLTLAPTISDTLGNTLNDSILIGFTTPNWHYVDHILMDAFSSAGNWWDPEGSGSTIGVIGSGTEFGYSSSIYLPASEPPYKSAYIAYQWDPNAGSHLLREYLSGGAPRSVEFDTQWVLQCYVYSDGSRNEFRFCIDEGNASSWTDHEVSQWITLDWEGWKLVEWDLSDPGQVGSWIGNGVLDGSRYRFDSFQLTWNGTDQGITGRVYVDNMRIIQREPGVGISSENAPKPERVVLGQAYPNPFNNMTRLWFDLPRGTQVELSLYDLKGRYVRGIRSGYFPAGRHQVVLTGNGLASGVYLCVLKTPGQRLVKRLLLLK